MRENLRCGLCSIVLLLSALPACAAGPQGPAGRFSSNTAAAQYHVMVGELAAARAHPQQAAEQFLAAHELTGDVELAQRAAAHALASHNDALILKTARRWLTAEPSSLDARELIARAALRTGDRAEVLAQCDGMVRDHAGGEADGYRHCALLLAQEPAHSATALNVFEQLLTKRPPSTGGVYAHGLLALRAGQFDVAERAARAALELQPDSSDARFLLAGVQVKQGRIADADATAEPLFRDNPAANDLRMGYARLLLEARQAESAARQFREVLKQNPDQTDAAVGLGLFALEAGRLDEAAGYFKPLAAAGPRRSDAAYYLGRIAQNQQRPADALNWYAQVDAGPQAFDALLRRADLLAADQRTDQALQLLQERREDYPPLTARLAPVQAELLLDAGRDADAKTLLDEALDDWPQQPDLLYARSLVHEKMQQPQQAEADLRQLLAVKPDDARSLNALGYLLTVHTQRYAEARGLIARALELEPDDPAIMDSMGWVLFRLGQPRDARVWLEKALARFHDAEIAAHLGEVLWHLGEKDQARQLWQAALRDAPDHAVLRETVQRLAP